MDIRLQGGTSGLEAARMLFECWGVRSIYISANLDPSTRAQAEPLQPLGFVGKPFLPAEVIDALERAVSLVPGEKNRGD
jgi:CheY-like chemotaxis protein